MHKNRMFRLIIALISLLMLVDSIQDSYAKYTSATTANAHVSIARWDILVNDQDVLNSTDFSETIIPEFVEDDNISEGVIAPTSQGYFDLLINSGNADVSFAQTITIEPSDTNTVTDLIITGYSVNESTTVLPLNSSSFTTNYILGTDETINTYRIYFMWYDGTDETMDNENDTQATIDGEASIKVSINFTQLSI